MKFEPHFAKRHALKLRFAQCSHDVAVAQRLRYLVFHEEMGAKLGPGELAAKLERDEFDSICEHLLVLKPHGDHPLSELSVADGEVVGTYRLLLQSVAERHGGFYSQREFDIAPLLARKRELRFVELGRSCVLQDYRGTAVVELLWQGIWNYVREQRIDVMLGCASFDGANPIEHAEALHFLQQTVNVPDDWKVRAHAHCYVAMGQKTGGILDAKRVLGNLPPLIKGYLRLGCYLGEGAVVDPQFNTTDVLVVLPVSAINPRYFSRFGAPTS